MKIPSMLPNGQEDPYFDISWEDRTYDGIPVVAPSTWSSTAVAMLAGKYMRRKEVPDQTVRVHEDMPLWLRPSVPAEDATFGREHDAREVFHRLAGCWSYWGWKGGYFDSEADARQFYNNMLWCLVTQHAAPNSPQFFNTGIHWAYGILGDTQGNWYTDENGVAHQAENRYQHPSSPACFIQSVSDDLVNPNGIMDLWTREAKIFKGGSGSGVNYSELRGKLEPLSAGGFSSGLESWLKIGDVVGGSIKSGGTTRRSSRMVSIDMDHPDVEDFITWKVREEYKVACLVAGSRLIARHGRKVFEASQDENGSLEHALEEARRALVPQAIIKRWREEIANGETQFRGKIFDLDWQGEAYQTVSGQNSNNSLSIPNEFMKAALNARTQEEQGWPLYWRTEKRRALLEGRDPVPCKVVHAPTLWENIAQAAWACADPGVQFNTTINEWHTSPFDGSICASNPCSEYVYLDDTACNLASLNLVRFYLKKERRFDISLFREACRQWTLVLEITVGMSQYPSKKTAENSYKFRPLGLGYANLGALLMIQGIPYDSEGGRGLAGAITCLMHSSAGCASAEMAGELGAFKGYEANKEAMLRVMRNHRAASVNWMPFQGLTIEPQRLIAKHFENKPYIDAARAAADKMVLLGEKHGYRNAQFTVLAPTGTIGLLMDCDTTGVEPDFALVKYKTLAGGGSLRLINQSVPPALEALGYSEQQIKDISEYAIGHKVLSNCPHRTKLFSAMVDNPNDEEATRVALAILYGAFDLSMVLPKNHGMTAQEVREVNDYICGRHTLEGAPYLKEEHLVIFDCANRCGRYGKRFISPEAHVRMVAAVQPFISGSVSKTINCPPETTQQQIGGLYALGWALMCKCMSVYRDGCKLSQVLETVAQETEEEPVVIRVAHAIVSQIAGRHRLPDRRFGYTQKARVGGHKVYMRTGEYEDGTLGEIFLDMNKEGATTRGFMNSLAISVSLGLQHGVPLDTYVNAFTFMKFEPNGAVQGNPHIKNCDSLVDYLFRELAVTYLGRHDLAHTPPKETDNGTQHARASGFATHLEPVVRSASGEMSALEIARLKGYTGEMCQVCGSLSMVKKGACSGCDDCGASGGCS